MPVMVSRNDQPMRRPRLQRSGLTAALTATSPYEHRPPPSDHGLWHPGSVVVPPESGRSPSLPLLVREPGGPAV